MTAEDRPKFGKFSTDGQIVEKSALPTAPSLPPASPKPAGGTIAAFGHSPEVVTPPTADTPMVPVVARVSSGDSVSLPPTGGAVKPHLATAPPSMYDHSPHPPRRLGLTRDPLGVAILGVLTLGIYACYWYYQVNRELRDYDSTIKVNPAVALMALMFGSAACYLPSLITWVNTANRVAQAQRIAGRPERCSGGTTLLLTFIPGGGMYYVQRHLNQLWAGH